MRQRFTHNSGIVIKNIEKFLLCVLIGSGIFSIVATSLYILLLCETDIIVITSCSLHPSPLSIIYLIGSTKAY